MKTIKINEQNKPAIQAALDEVNGKATAFTLRFAQDVLSLANEAEDEFNGKLDKKSRVGLTFVYTTQAPGSKAYKYAAKGTRIEMVRRPTGWFLTMVESVDVYPTQKARRSFIVTHDQAATIKANAIRPYVVVG